MWDNGVYLRDCVSDWKLIGLVFDWDVQWTAELILLTDVVFLTGNLISLANKREGGADGQGCLIVCEYCMSTARSSWTRSRLLCDCS